MKKVVKLKLIKKPKCKAHPEDVELIKHILEDLSNGTVEEVAIVGLNRDGTMLRGWSKPRRSGNAFRMVGSMEKLREEYLRKEIET